MDLLGNNKKNGNDSNGQNNYQPFDDEKQSPSPRESQQNEFNKNDSNNIKISLKQENNKKGKMSQLGGMMKAKLGFGKNNNKQNQENPDNIYNSSTNNLNQPSLNQDGYQSDSQQQITVDQNFQEENQQQKKSKRNILKDKLSQGKEKMKNAVSGTKAFQKYQEKKRGLNVYIRKKQEDAILKGLSMMKPKVKKKMQDPFLYKPLKNMVDEIFEENWSLVVEEVQFQFRMRKMEPYVDGQNIPTNCLQKIAANFNYIMQPNDKSFGKQLRDWKYIVLQIISLMPFGVQSAFYFFNFMCIDKRDEYQLIFFILDYKKMQWLTQGVFLGIIGYFKFYNCVSLAKGDEEQDNVYKTCVLQGPGSDSNAMIQLVSFLVNLGLIWMCMILLPFSKQKGRPKFKVVEDFEGKSQIQESVIEKPKGCCACMNWDRGGKLKGLMLFDLFSFILATIVYLYTYHYLEIQSISQSGQQIQFSRWMYGMLGFPFLLFNIPIFLNLLTHSKKTCYDINGNCVPPKIDVQYADEDELENLFKVDEMLDFGENLDSNNDIQ